ncbi:MAG: hypothetical protein P1U86_06350 [Verrucomicrobiales bacterium]|nr:hypothetical protein [Verrucomicrobiales bacterium]
MKVLIVADQNARFEPRGGEVLLESIKDRLSQFGLFAVDYERSESGLNSVIAIFVFSLSALGKVDAEKFHRAGIPVYCWPFFWSGGEVMGLDERVEYVFNSKAENDCFVESLRITDPLKCRVVGLPALDRYTPRENKLFCDVIGRTEYLLTVGTIEERNNQTGVIELAQGTNAYCVFVGPVVDVEYHQRCLQVAEEAGVECLFMGGLPFGGRLINSAYNNCSYYIEVSFDPPGLSSVEAFNSGAKCILSNPIWVAEVFGDRRGVVALSEGHDTLENIMSTMENPDERYSGVEFDNFIQSIISK